MYKHTQVGWIMIITAGILMAFLPIVLLKNGSISFNIGIPFGIGISILFLFSTLTVMIDNEFVKCSFGVGLIRKNIILKDIVSCKTAKNKWWYGIGIHGCPGKKWLYNVSGLDSVELTMKNEIRYRIGTDEPNKLCEAIQSRIR